MSLLPALLVFAGSALARPAGVQIAFLEFRTPDGTLIQFEPGGRFAHVAISFRDGWLHAHPQRGVEVVNTEELSRLGRVAEVVNLPQLREIPESIAQKFIGKPYDDEFSWSDDRIYCSELVAKLFGLKPEPMHFDRALWPPRFWRLEGRPGLSPDKIYRRLKVADLKT